jgi:hypothetical protein
MLKGSSGVEGLEKDGRVSFGKAMMRRRRGDARLPRIDWLVGQTTN